MKPQIGDKEAVTEVAWEHFKKSGGGAASLRLINAAFTRGADAETLLSAIWKEGFYCALVALEEDAIRPIGFSGPKEDN